MPPLGYPGCFVSGGKGREVIGLGGGNGGIGREREQEGGRRRERKGGENNWKKTTV